MHTKATKAKGRMQRSRDGLPFAQIRRTDFENEPERQFSASAVGVHIVGYGATPTLARAELERLLGEPITPNDRESGRLLRTPFKRPGQNPGGKPRRALARSSSPFTMRFTEEERAALRAFVEAEQIPSEAEAVRRGLRKLGALPVSK